MDLLLLNADSSFLAHGSSALLGSLESWLNNPLFERWEGSLFQKATWSQVMLGTRVILAALGALLLMYELRARRMHVRIGVRVRRRIAIALTSIAFLTYFDFFNPNVRYDQYYHRHEFFHYYLGSKYFKEVGYNRLYECTAIAEVENGRRASIAGREIRDLRVNLIKPIKDTYILTEPEICKKHFTPERWETFRKEVNWFHDSARGTYWENMLKDHGYNPPPVWTMAGKFLGSFAPAGDAYFKALATLDIAFMLASVLLIYWAFGWRTMMVATIFWGTNRSADFYWTGGAFMRQDWIFFLVASVCCARKRKFALAGGALTWSALLRVFPVALFFGWAVIIAIHVIKQVRARLALAPKRRKPLGLGGLLGLLHPDHRRLLAGCVIAAGTLIPTSVVVTGADSYENFIKHTMTVHRNTPLTNHMGIDTILTHTWDGRMRFTRDDNLDDPFAGWKQGRLDRAKSLWIVRKGLLVFFMLWIVWALRRTKLLWVGPALSVVLVMALADLTCYYYSFFILLATLVRARPSIGPAFLAGSGASALLLSDAAGFYYVDDRFTVQAYLFLLLAVLSLYTYSRPFSMDRLKAWWDGKPEPKGNRNPEQASESGPVAAGS